MKLRFQTKKIEQNKAQYDLDRKAAKISALSSKELDKYEYLTGEDLGHKPNVFEQANLIVMHLVIFLLRDWIRKIKKEGIFKRLENIKD